MPPLVPNEHSDALPDTSSVPDPSTLNDEALSELLVKETRSRTGITPYPWQVRVAVAMIRQRDVLCLAGTGFGKTLPFIMPLFLSVKTIVWIISPLNYIEEQQAESFKKWGAMAVAVNSNTDFRQVKKDILSGVYNVVISSPESFHAESCHRVAALQYLNRDYSALCVNMSTRDEKTVWRGSMRICGSDRTVPGR